MYVWHFWNGFLMRRPSVPQIVDSTYQFDKYSNKHKLDFENAISLLAFSGIQCVKPSAGHQVWDQLRVNGSSLKATIA